MHLRLVRALIHSRTAGRLSRDVGDEVREAAASPPPELLGVLDPRPYTLMIAEIHSRPGFSVAGAELVGAAIAADAELPDRRTQPRPDLARDTAPNRPHRLPLQRR